MPPSVHPSGEIVAWNAEGEPAAVPADALHAACARLAAAALLARHWPAPGGRHDAALALAGTLLRAGWPEEAIARFVAAVAAAAGDPEGADRVRAVRSTMERLRAGEPATGLPTLTAAVGEPVAQKLAAWLSVAARPRSSQAATKSARPTQAAVLAALGRDHAELFCDSRWTAYARLALDDHHEIWPIRSKAFRRWLVGQYYALTQGQAPNADSINAALLVLEAHAQFEGAPRAVYLRVAPDDAGGLFLDLGDPAWRAVHVTPTGWRVVDHPPVCFRRSPGLQALPVPAPGGDLEALRALVNIPDDDGWALTKAWLVAALCADGPYPVLVLTGEQGCGKSCTARVLRALVDPATPELRAEPRELRDLAIAAENAWLLAFDNVSTIAPWLSDGLCRLSTGGGWATRELWTDQDEILFAATRPMLLNGISDFITRGDLLDRTIQLALPPIPEEARRLEAEVWRAFTDLQPRLFGALLDRVSAALRERANVRLDRLPRMADFAVLAVAAERGRGEPPRFLTAYRRARAEADVQAVEASALGPVLLGWLDEVSLLWEGTATELLALLAARGGEQAPRQRGWPKTARGLRSELDRLAPSLRRLGWSVTFGRAGHGGPRHVRVESLGAQPSPPSPPSPLFEEPRALALPAKERGDGTVTQPSPTVTQPSPTVTQPSPTVTQPSPDPHARTRAGAQISSGGDDGDGGDGSPPQYSGSASEARAPAAQWLPDRSGWLLPDGRVLPWRPGLTPCPECGGPAELGALCPLCYVKRHGPPRPGSRPCPTCATRGALRWIPEEYALCLTCEKAGAVP